MTTLCIFRQGCFLVVILGWGTEESAGVSYISQTIDVGNGIFVVDGMLNLKCYTFVGHVANIFFQNYSFLLLLHGGATCTVLYLIKLISLYWDILSTGVVFRNAL